MSLSIVCPTSYPGEKVGGFTHHSCHIPHSWGTFYVTNPHQCPTLYVGALVGIAKNNITQHKKYNYIYTAKEQFTD